MLLHSVVGDEIRIEVSLPVAADDLNEADEWIERIVLDPILREPPPDITLDDGGPDVDVDVRRRSDG